MKEVCRRSSFIRQFSGPRGGRIVCFKFWQAVVASGCPGECAYCFLQTQFPYRRGLYCLKGTVFRNLRDIESEARRWLAQPKPAGLIVGENQDGLAFEHAYKRSLGITPLELLIPLFEDASANRVGHTLIVLTKFTCTEYAEALGPSQHVVFSWSLSLPGVSARYERKVADLESRLVKASAMKHAGYRIRLRLDALAPVPGWEADMASVVARINEIGPELLTVGALRASNVGTLRCAAYANGRDGSIFDYLTVKDPAGFKYRTGFGFQVMVFTRIRELLDDAIPLALCKEDREVWKAVGLPWRGCHCLHGASDAIAAGSPHAEASLSSFTT